MQFFKGKNKPENLRNVSGDRAVSSEEWGSKSSSGNLGKLIELKGNNVVVIGTLEADATIAGMPSFRISVIDSESNSQKQLQIIMNKLLLMEGIKVEDRVEIHGKRSTRGFIEAIAILNLDTQVLSGKLKYPRFWLFFAGFFLLIFGSIASSMKGGPGPLMIMSGVLFLLLFLFFKRKLKFISQQ